MAIVLALTLVTGATAAMLRLGRLAARPVFCVSRLGYINTQSTYQATLLGVAGLVLGVIYVANPANLHTFLAWGNIAAPAGHAAWLPLPDGTSWLALGISLCLFITAGTSTFVYLQFRKTAGGLARLIPFMPWVLAFSLSNACAEEIIYRLGIIVPLAGSVGTPTVLLLSAVAFGAPHLRGMPNGIVGALMAGLLGWLLAKSVVETQGMFWAWLIHFLQDVVIFSAFVMAAVNKAPQAADISSARTE